MDQIDITVTWGVGEIVIRPNNQVAFNWCYDARDGDGLIKVIAEYLSINASSAGLTVEGIP